MRSGNFWAFQRARVVTQSIIRPPAATNEPDAVSGTFSQDLLFGAGAIAAFLFGGSEHRRKVYHLAQSGQLPVFRLGTHLCARRSTLIAWIEAQEMQSDG